MTDRGGSGRRLPDGQARRPAPGASGPLFRHQRGVTVPSSTTGRRRRSAQAAGGQGGGMTTCAPRRPQALADLIAYAWFQIGFRPRDSVVVVGMRQARLAGAVARIDRPPRRHEAAADRGVGAAASADRRRPRWSCCWSPTVPRSCRTPAWRAAWPTASPPTVSRCSTSSRWVNSTSRPTSAAMRGAARQRVTRSRRWRSSSVAADMVLRGRSCVAAEADLVADVRPMADAGSRVDRPPTWAFR